MDKRRNISKQLKGKLASRPLRNAAVSGLVVSGLAAASLAGVPNADATCIGISGIDIGDGCDSSLGSFALVLGTGTAITEGFLNAAISVGTNVDSQAGVGVFDFLNLAANFGNATDPATSIVEASFGAFNIAANLGGNANNNAFGEPVDMTVFAGGTEGNLGFGTAAINIIGNRNNVQAIGTLDVAINWGGAAFPNGSDSIVTAGSVEEGPSFLGLAFNRQGPFTDQTCPADCGNTVRATGPLALAAAINVVQREAIREGFGVTIATQGNETVTGVTSTGSNTNVLAASGTQGNRVRSSFDATADRPVLKSVKKVRDQLAASNKKFKDAVKSAADRRAAGADAGAGTTSNSDK